MRFEKNDWGCWEVDFYDESESNLLVISNLLQMRPYELSCFMKTSGVKPRGGDWIARSSGMTFNLKNMSYYQKLQDFLDREFNKFLRKEKLKNIIKSQ